MTKQEIEDAGICGVVSKHADGTFILSDNYGGYMGSFKSKYWAMKAAYNEFITVVYEDLSQID